MRRTNRPTASCSLGDLLWPGLLHGAHIEIEQTLALVALFLVLLSKFDHLFEDLHVKPFPFSLRKHFLLLFVQLQQFGVQIFYPFNESANFAAGKAIETTAPFAQLDVVHYSPTHTVEALEKDEIDLAISMGLAHSNSIKSVVLMKDRMVCVMREAHPLAQRPLTMETFLQATHLKVSMSPTDLRFVDDVLARQGLTRRVAVNVPHWLLVPHVLRDSDLLSVMPRRLAFSMVAEDLAIRDLPFASEPFEWSMYWHRRHDASPDLNWLRSIFVDAARGLPESD